MTPFLSLFKRISYYYFFFIPRWMLLLLCIVAHISFVRCKFLISLFLKFPFWFFVPSSSHFSSVVITFIFFVVVLPLSVIMFRSGSLNCYSSVPDSTLVGPVLGFSNDPPPHGNCYAAGSSFCVDDCLQLV